MLINFIHRPTRWAIRQFRGFIFWTCVYSCLAWYLHINGWGLTTPEYTMAHSPTFKAHQVNKQTSEVFPQ